MPLTLIMVKAEVKEKLQALIISSLWYNTKRYMVLMEVKDFLVFSSDTSWTEFEAPGWKKVLNNI